MENRAFFSIIIPCYNTKPDNMRMLLESIKNQNIADDIEVIIADDRSTQVDFYDVIEEYKNILNIKTIISNTEVAHCPGNTREAGASIATGEWITFVDHDDELIEDIYKKVKEEILKAGEQYVASCNFYEVDPYNGNILNEFCHVGNQMHGKFYNLDNFQRAKNFHFKKDLLTHEDIYISSKTICELHRLDRLTPYYIEIFCMKWKAQVDSTSRTKYKERNFLEYNFGDYIDSTLGCYIDDWFYSVNELQDTSDKNYYDHIRSCISVILYMYFYIQGFKFNFGLQNYLLENEIMAKKCIRKVCKIFNITTDFIYACTADNAAAWFNEARTAAKIGVGNFIETETFYNFITF